MLKINRGKSKSGIGIKVKRKFRDEEEFHVKEIFIGRRTLLTFSGVASGSTLIGRSIWEVLYRDWELGFINTVLIGLIVLSISGFYLGNYEEPKEVRSQKVRKKSKKHKLAT